MKIKSKNIVSVIVIIIGVLTFYGCDKENEINNVQLKTKTKEQRIISFIKKMNACNANLKSSEEKLQKDSALWNLEATLNYTYADAIICYEKYILDTSSIECLVTEDSINITDITQAYDKIKDSVSYAYAEINEQNKHLVAVDLYIQSIENNIATIGIISGFNNGPMASSGVFNEPYDYWRYGEAWMDNGGYCDGPYAGTEFDESAATQIERIIRLRTGTPSGRHYYTDLITMEVDYEGNIYIFETQETDFYYLINPNDATTEDNFYDYLLFHNYSPWPNFHDCLEPDEMNFYLESTEKVFKETLINEIDIINDKVFISCDISGTAIFNYYTRYIHYSINEYGVVNYTNEPKSSL